MVNIQAYPYTSNRFTFAVTSLPFVYSSTDFISNFFFKVGHILLTLDSYGTFYYCSKNAGMILVGQMCGKTCFCTDTSSYISII